MFFAYDPDYGFMNRTREADPENETSYLVAIAITTITDPTITRTQEPLFDSVAMFVTKCDLSQRDRGLRLSLTAPFLCIK